MIYTYVIYIYKCPHSRCMDVVSICYIHITHRLVGEREFNEHVVYRNVNNIIIILFVSFNNRIL